MSHPKTTMHIGMLIVLAMLATAMFLPSYGTDDIQAWLEWGRNVDQHGLIQGYIINEHEHPPLFSVLLWLIFKASHLTSLTPFICLKVSFAIFLCLSSTTLYIFSKKNILFTLFFHSVMLYSSLCLSYMDIYFSFFILLSCLFLYNKKIPAFIFLFTTSCLIKYPPLIVAPFCFLYLLKSDHGKLLISKGELIKLIKQSIPAIVLVGAIFLIFSNEPFLALKRAFNHGALSYQALNLNWIFTRILILNGYESYSDVQETASGMILSPPLWIILTSKFLFLSFYLSALLCFFLSKKTLENLLLWAIIGHFSYFIFNTGAHENHLILSVALGMAASCVNNKYLPLAIGLALISTLNMFVFYGTNGFGPLILSNKIDLIFSQCQAIWGDISSSCNAEFSKLRYSYNFPSEFSMFKDGYPYDIKLALAIFNVTYFLTLWSSNIKNMLISARNNQ